MKNFAYKQFLESSSLFLDLPEGTLNRMDLFFSNTDLSKNKKDELMEIYKEIYLQGYENALID